MKLPKLVETKAELRSNVAAFAAGLPSILGKASAAAMAIANGCSHAVEWVAFPDGKGGWQVAFCKYVGYNGMTFDLYDKLRQTDLTGTDTKRRVEKLGGTYFGVGADARLPSTHPAVDAVKTLCAKLDKTPKRTAKVRVFESDERLVAFDILAAAIRAAKLNLKELEALFTEVRLAA
ncbi:MAG: hypothetical protein QOH04_2765 [Sphingomonadales bacterium]|jgi:hypothetical protein|nr:hypothetical protein [Sphingomonadales bacterium]